MLNNQDEQDLSVAINELHQKAMSLADRAFYAKKEHDFEEAQSTYLEAFEYEKAAAILLVNDYNQEPTRSVLFRSAANLLLNLPFPNNNHFRQAEKMIAYGLSGNPPEEIAEELREAWSEVVTFFQQEAA